MWGWPFRGFVYRREGVKTFWTLWFMGSFLFGTGRRLFNLFIIFIVFQKQISCCVLIGLCIRNTLLDCIVPIESTPVHSCPTSCRWTPGLTLNKKSQDCLVIMYLLNNRLPDIITSFPGKTCLYTLGQHQIINFLVQCCLKRIWTMLIRQYSCAILTQHGPQKVQTFIFLIKVVC